MRLRLVCYLVTHARRQVEEATIRQLGLEFARDAKQNVPLLTPVIGAIARGVLHKPDPNWSELLSSPSCYPGLTGVFGGVEVLPIGDPEGDVIQVHKRRLEKAKIPAILPGELDRARPRQRSDAALHWLGEEQHRLIRMVGLQGHQGPFLSSSDGQGAVAERSLQSIR
jgi:hypothetical protein